MIAIDTNVLVRYLVQDDPVQGALATRLMEDAAKRKELIFLSVVVLCEAVWVLKSVYRLGKPDLLPSLEHILTSGSEGPDRLFEVERFDHARAALDDYATGPADFADYLIGRLAHAAGATTTYTFDRRASAAPTFKRLG